MQLVLRVQWKTGADRVNMFSLPGKRAHGDLTQDFLSVLRKTGPREAPKKSGYLDKEV